MSARIDFRNAVWDSTDLKPMEKFTALAFEKHAGKGTERVWVTPAQLRRDTGLCRDTTTRAIRELRAKGWLVQVEKPRQHYAARYRLVIPQTYVSRTSDERDDRSDELSRRTGDDTRRTGDDARRTGDVQEQLSQQVSKQFRPDGRAQSPTTERDDDRYERVKAEVERQLGWSIDSLDESKFYGLYETYDDGTRSEVALVRILTNVMYLPWQVTR